MNKLWIILLPLLYLPNLGAGFSTMFGEIELAAMLLFPYMLCFSKT
jgi:hypothetical protein